MPSKVIVDKHAKCEETESAPKVEIPSNWPEDITFLRDQTYSVAVTPELKAKLSRTLSDDVSWIQIKADLIQIPCPWVNIVKIEDPAHPAQGQRGLFAKEHLQPDSFICLYLGHVHCNSLSDTDPNSDYDLSLDREIGLSVDAANCGNESRCANDYRGIAERPNAEFRDCFIQVPSPKRADRMKWERRVGIFVLGAGKAGKRKAGIKAGEEIVVSYGSSYWTQRQRVASFRNDVDMLRIATAALEA